MPMILIMKQKNQNEKKHNTVIARTLCCVHTYPVHDTDVLPKTVHLTMLSSSSLRLLGLYYCSFFRSLFALQSRASGHAFFWCLRFAPSFLPPLTRRRGEQPALSVSVFVVRRNRHHHQHERHLITLKRRGKKK